MSSSSPRSKSAARWITKRAPDEAAAIYSRVSSYEQAAHGTSSGDQVARGLAYAAEQGLTVVGTFVDADTGTDMLRPGMDALRVAVEAGSIRHVIITDPDRISRDALDGLILEREWERQFGVTVTYLTNPEMSPLERHLRSIIAAEEHSKILRRSADGRRIRAAEGAWLGGRPPFGYRVDRRGASPKLVINKTEAATIIRALELTLDEHRSPTEAVNIMNAERRPSRIRGQWTTSTLRSMLGGLRAISGEFPQRLEGSIVMQKVPAIVSVERHSELAAYLQLNGRKPTARVGDYLLAGGRLVGECGHVMYGVPRKSMTELPGRTRVIVPKHDVYTCSTKLAGGAKACGHRHLPVDDIDERVWAQIAALLSTPDVLMEIAGICSAASDPTQTSDASAVLDGKIRCIETAMTEQVSKLLAAGMDTQVVTAATAKLADELARLRRRRSKTCVAPIDKTTQSLLALHAAETLRTADHALRSDLMRILDVTVHVTGWRPCSHCGGSGQVTPPGTGRRGRATCPECERFGGRPIIHIELGVEHRTAAPQRIAHLDA